MLVLVSLCQMSTVVATTWAGALLALGKAYPSRDHANHKSAHFWLRLGDSVQDFWGAGLYLACSAAQIVAPFNASKAPLLRGPLPAINLLVVTSWEQLRVGCCQPPP